MKKILMLLTLSALLASLLLPGTAPAQNNLVVQGGKGGQNGIPGNSYNGESGGNGVITGANNGTVKAMKGGAGSPEATGSGEIASPGGGGDGSSSPASGATGGGPNGGDGGSSRGSSGGGGGADATGAGGGGGGTSGTGTKRGNGGGGGAAFLSGTSGSYGTITIEGGDAPTYPDAGYQRGFSGGGGGAGVLADGDITASGLITVRGGSVPSTGNAGGAYFGFSSGNLTAQNGILVQSGSANNTASRGGNAELDLGTGTFTNWGDAMFQAGSGIAAGNVTVTLGNWIQNGDATLTSAGGNVTATTGNLSLSPGRTLTLTNGPGTANLTVNDTLQLTAALNAADAPLQGNGTLTLGTASRMNIGFADYSLPLGSPGTGYLNNGVIIDNLGSGTPQFSPAPLFEVQPGSFAPGTWTFAVTRLDANTVFPDLTPGIGDVVNGYGGGNPLLEDRLASEAGTQSAFDLLNQSGGANQMYNLWRDIRTAQNSRALQQRPRSGFGHSGLVRGQAPQDCAVREAWFTPLYGNYHGGDLQSGGFHYGYESDQYAFAFGFDKTYCRSRLGIMGFAGWGNSRSTGQLFRTDNDTAFGGVYGYFSRSFTGSGLDFFGTVGWLGMNNDVTQGALSGDFDNGIASVSGILSKPYCWGRWNVVPHIGLEYGYYYQGSLNAAGFQYDRGDANLLVLPVGLKMNRTYRCWTPELRAQYIANLGDVVSDYDVWVVGSPVSALMSSAIADRHAGDIGGGLSWTRCRTTVRGDCGYMFSEHYDNLYAAASLCVRF